MLGGAGAGVGAGECSNPPGTPTVANVTPPDGAGEVFLNAPVTANVNLPNCGGIDPATVTNDTVRLLKMPNAVPVPANANTSGGGDVIVVQPTVPLAATTTYTFQVTAGLKDLSGAAFTPFSSSFTTGSTLEPTGNGGFTKGFDKKPTSAPGLKGGPGYTSVVVGPDHKLYAGTNYGEIKRFPIDADGNLGAEESIMTLVNHAGPRVIIGMAFDPASTAENPILWITNNEAVLKDAPEWTGVISKLTGPGLGTIEDKIIHLPRSAKDHLTNSLAFHNGKLYVTQGSNSSLGAPDNAWGQRPERLLNATVMEIDPTKLPASGPLDVLTPDGGGTYNPFAADAPLKIYATGLRNAFDLVWHSNGHLYAPTNGAAGGGRAPATPATLPAACKNRIDKAIHGDYTGPQVPEVKNVGEQHDYLFDVVQGGYYGHPNAGRCEWVLNGGNPTAGADPNEISFNPSGTPLYPVGTQPDRNYRGSAYDFGLHYSTNGVIEYSSNAYNSELKGRLMVTRYSSGDDIIVLTPDASGKIVASQTGIPGMSGFANPLDIAMDPMQGNLYVTEYPDPSTDARPSKITLLRATEPGTPPPPPSTDTVAPTITSRVPAPDATGVAITSNISVGFSEAMNAGSVNATSFSVAPAAGGPALAGGITAAPGNVFTLNPTANLVAGTLYRVTVGTGATDAAGNPLAAADSWTFKTAAKTEPGGTDATTTGDKTVRPPTTKDTPTKAELRFCNRYPRSSALLARQMKAAKHARAKAKTARARKAATKRIAAVLKKQRAAKAGYRKNGCKAIETAAFCKAYPKTSRALAKKLAAAKKARTKATTAAAKRAAAKKVATLTKQHKAAVKRHTKSCKASR
jgi:hypothetical protein